jgi:hypothetical protein
MKMGFDISSRKEKQKKLFEEKAWKEHQMLTRKMIFL